ncbi:MAG TPA: hypothetical protein DCL26_11575 [Alteromonas australica]|nr:hypothetical protein [Alteromonas australica]
MGVVQGMGEALEKNALLAHTKATTPRENMVNTLAQLALPTGIIAAKDDRIAMYNQLMKMADNIPTATRYTVNDSGHMLPLEQPAQLAELVTSFISA